MGSFLLSVVLDMGRVFY